MAPHGRYHKWICAPRAEKTRHRTKYNRQIVQSTASRCNTDPLALKIWEMDAAQRFYHRFFRIINVRIIEMLLNANHIRQREIQSILDGK